MKAENNDCIIKFKVMEYYPCEGDEFTVETDFGTLTDAKQLMTALKVANTDPYKDYKVEPYIAVDLTTTQARIAHGQISSEEVLERFKAGETLSDEAIEVLLASGYL